MDGPAWSRAVGLERPPEVPSSLFVCDPIQFHKITALLLEPKTLLVAVKRDQFLGEEMLCRLY